MTTSDKNQNLKAMSLEKYIDEYFDGSQAAFARAQGVERQQVTQWMKNEFIVVNDCLYSKRRELNKVI